MNNEKPQVKQQNILLTGATGFLGQAVLREFLENYPYTHITTLVRPRGSVSAQKRLEGLLEKPSFAGWVEKLGAEEALRQFKERVHVLEGDLQNVGEVTTKFDTVVHSASTVSFDPPIDEAFTINVGGAKNLYEMLLATGQDPHVIHVSTAYVGGMARGLRQEGSLKHDIDWETEFQFALQARDEIEAISRQPEHLRKFMKEAQRTTGKMGPKASALVAEDLRQAWVNEQLVDQGRLRAQSVGWTDIYTFTKAMAERVGETKWRANGHRLSFVRPSIIESAVKRPYPGWIDGYKVADPLIMAYGKGLLSQFPGLADSILDIIPVDHVVNVIVALATQNVDRRDDEAYYQVVSGNSNPLPFHQMVEDVQSYFTAHPLTDDQGKEIKVPDWNFEKNDLVETKFMVQEKAIKAASQVTRFLPATNKTRAISAKINKNNRLLGQLRKYMDLYKQYTKTEMVFDDSNTRALRASLSPEFLAQSDFDITAVDWDRYFIDQHFPAVTELTKAYSEAKKARLAAQKRGPQPLTENREALAVFDLDGTVVAQNIVQQYLQLVKASQPLSAWPKAGLKLLSTLPQYALAEQRDRSEFIRIFNRRFAGFTRAELENLLAGEVGQQIRDSIREQARERIAAHRAAGHRVVLVTGALDVWVAPIADLFDDVIASHMHEKDGVMTGYLATPPLVGEARANWLRKYAAEHGLDLQASYGYGDSHADAAWLELLGNPAVVHPDLGLHAIAKKKHWPMLDW